MLNNDFSSCHRNYLWNQALTQGRTIIRRITIITTTGECLYTCSFSCLSTFHAPHTHQLNSGAQTQVLLDDYLEYMSCSIDKPAWVYPGIKNPVTLSHNGLPLASPFTTIVKLIIHRAMYNETRPYGVSLKNRKKRQRSNQVLGIKKFEQLSLPRGNESR